MPSSSKAPNVAKDIESDMKTKCLSVMDCIIALISIAGLLWVRVRALPSADGISSNGF